MLIDACMQTLDSVVCLGKLPVEVLHDAGTVVHLTVPSDHTIVHIRRLDLPSSAAFCTCRPAKVRRPNGQPLVGT